MDTAKMCMWPSRRPQSARGRWRLKNTNGEVDEMRRKGFTLIELLVVIAIM